MVKTSAGDRKSVTDVLRKFAEESSIHGVQYIGARGGSIAFKLFWTAIFLAALCGLLSTLFVQLIALLSYPSRLVTDVEIANQLKFPAVTVCNMNYMRKSGASHFPELETLLLSIAGSSIVTNSSLSDVNNYNSTITETNAQFLRNLAHSAEMTFLQCFWDGHLRECEDLFQKQTTSHGVCFTFNAQTNGLNESLVSGRTGPEDGLVVVMNVHQSEYIPTKNRHSAGFRVFLHEFSDVPFKDKSFNIAPGFSTSVKLKMRQIEFLPEPYKAYGNTTCMKHRSSGKLKYFPRYDTGACYWECKIDYILEKCGCKNIYDPATVPAPYCTISQLSLCFNKEEDEFWINSSLKSACPCFPLCSQLLFQTSQSLTYYPSDAFAEQLEIFSPSDLDQYRKNILELRLYYDDFFYETMKQEPLYTFESLTAAVGGQMGLYLGISLLSVVEVLHMVTKCSWAALRRCFCRQRTKVRALDKDQPRDEK